MGLATLFLLVNLLMKSWCYHLNETSSIDLLRSRIYFLWYYEKKFRFFGEFSLWTPLRVNKEQFHCEPRLRVQTLCCCLQWLQLSRSMICLIYGHNFRCFSFVALLNCLLAFLLCGVIKMLLKWQWVRIPQLLLPVFRWKCQISLLISWLKVLV